jgi:hypothetical protein
MRERISAAEAASTTADDRSAVSYRNADGGQGFDPDWFPDLQTVDAPDGTDYN